MGLQSGVYPCYKNQFSIGANGETATSIAECETFSISIDNGIEEWKPFEHEGWVRRLMTAKSITISVSGKRNVGDTGNDFVANKWLKNGRDAEAYFAWIFPDGGKVEFNDAIISVKNLGAGDATGVAPLEFDILSNGKPNYTPASS